MSAYIKIEQEPFNEEAYEELVQYFTEKVSWKDTSIAATGMRLRHRTGVLNKLGIFKLILVKGVHALRHIQG